MSAKRTTQEVEQDRLNLIKLFGPDDFKDMLHRMFELQEQFGSKFIPFQNSTVQEKEKWTKELIVCCMDELTEILNCTNHRHWKKPVYPLPELELKYELIDLWHFVMSLMILWGIKPQDLYTMYLAKNRENHNRQAKGY
jgi:hypothetical protein